MKNSQKHISLFAFLGHRLSGLALALFLPFHFLLLALALESPQRLDGFLKWADQPAVKFAEWGLVALLAIHLSFGLRVLIMENFAWSGQRKSLIWVSIVFSFACATFFLIRSF